MLAQENFSKINVADKILVMAKAELMFQDTV